MAKKSLIAKAKREPRLQGAEVLALQPLRPAARRLQEVRPLPDLPARPRARGPDPGHDQIELVTTCIPIRSQTCSPASATPTRRCTNRRRCRPPAIKEEIARLLKEEGYITDFRVEDGESFNTLTIDLKFGRNRERIITDLKRISKPGRRVYARKDRLPRVLGGMGTAILSTSGGLITSKTAEQQGVGGEVVCFVW